MSAGWMVLVAALWLVMLVLGILVLGLIRRVNELERARRDGEGVATDAGGH